MTMTTRKKSLLAIILVIVAGAATAVFLLLGKYLEFETYRNTIIDAVQKRINRTVRFQQGSFSFRFGPAFSLQGIDILEKDGKSTFASAKKLTFRLALLPLLHKKIILSELHLDQPSINLMRDKNGRFNVDDLLQEKKEDSPLQISGVQIKHGNVRFTDFLADPQGEPLSFQNLDLTLNHFTRGKNCSFRISSAIDSSGNKGTISVNGSMKLAPVGRPLAESSVDARIAAKHLDVGRGWPYYQAYVPFRKITALLSIDSEIKGKLSAFTSRGEMRFSGLRFDYPQVFHAVLTPRDLHFKYDMQLTPRDITVKSLDLNLDGLRAKGSCALRDIPSGDMRITARATMSPFRLEDFRQYIPYGIIVKDTADYIEQHIKGGVYRLDEGTLDGRVSQIAHMEKGDNYNVLYIRARVERGLLIYGSDVPTFNSISGELEMRGKDFNLNHMAGNFGTSPLTLEGKITDYPLDKPSGYPFTLVMTPRQPEAAWLFDRQKTGKLLLAGSSTLRLSGDGFTSGYNLSGDWDLSRAEFSYPDIISKPGGRLTNLQFKGSLNKEEARLQSLSVQLASLRLSASTVYRYGEKKRFACEIRTNRFPAGEIAPYLPRIAKYQPKGNVQASISGASSRDDVRKIRWGGDISFSNGSLKLADGISPLSNITGTVRFSDNALETSQLTVRLGSSTLSGRGMLVGFSNPEFNVDFSSPALALTDLGLRSPGHEVKITRVAGNLSFKDNNLNIRSLAGQVNSSVLAVKGQVADLDNPKADISVNASYLDVADIMALTDVESVRPRQGPPRRIIIKAAVATDSGKVGSLSVEKLRASLSVEDKILYLQPVEFRAYGGHINAKGRFDFGSNGAARHQINYTVEGVQTERLTKALGFKKQEVTGILNFSGDLTAKGTTSLDIRRTALGSARLQIEEGTLRKFSVLSKVFSILNVSQLLKGQLPDMVSGGMPFNKISATLAFHDGFVSSDNLFVDSDAINISVIGKMDMVREELDATIGVQPLQTVDKVVSHLPIVGWILTGKNKALITAYFEAKGKVDDPVVKAIPVKSLTKGAFNIFKRIFQLPAKLFTDTGEVIMGK